jgi:hypothetical protein
MISKAEEASAEYSLMLFSSAHISYWSKPVRELQRAISEKNYLFLQKADWLHHYKDTNRIYPGQNIIIDDPETFYLALIKKENGKREHVAHFKIAPQGEVTRGIGQNHFQKTAEQLIGQEAARSGFGIFSSRNTNTFSDRYLEEKEGGYYTINPSEDAAEIIQFCGEKKYVLPLLLGAYMIGLYEDIEKLILPSFIKKDPTEQDRADGEQAKNHFLNIFRQRIFYGTSGASSAPPLFISGLNAAFRLWGKFKTYGLSEYIYNIIQADNPYKVFNEEKETYEITDPENSDKWENNTKAQWEKILALWENHMETVSERDSVTTEDLKRAHKTFVDNLSQINSVALFIANVVGSDPPPLGSIVEDLNKPDEYYRAFLWPPFAFSTQAPYHFFSEMFRRMYESSRDELGIDFSQVKLLGPNLSPVFPNDHEARFCEEELRNAARLRDYLGDSEEGVITSNYRSNVPLEMLRAGLFYGSELDHGR